MGNFLAQGRRGDATEVIGHDLELVREQGLDRVVVRRMHVVADVQRRRHAKDLGHADRFEHADRGPADIELEAAQGELGRAREGVMVVVQFLTTDDEAPRRQVGRGVVAFDVAIAPPVAESVDDAGGHERDPDHLAGPDDDAPEAEQGESEEQHQGRTEFRIAAVDVALEPVVRRTATVLLGDRRILARRPIQVDAIEQHLLDAVDLRAVRIFRGFALGVVLAVDRHPLLGHHGRGEPGPEAEEMGEYRVEVDAAVGLAAMQVQGHREDRELRDDDEIDDQHRPGRMGQAIGKKRDNRIEHEIPPGKSNHDYTRRLPGSPDTCVPTITYAREWPNRKRMHSPPQALADVATNSPTTSQG